ncbi:MAG: hypothetical protein WC941_08340 [Candidatus Bathyarchaeia archaeon]
MESRASFLRWYVLIRDTLGSLVPRLSDVEVMEYVSDGVLTVPVLGVGEERRPLPALEVTSSGEWLALAIVYRDAEGVKHLRNLLHPSQSAELGRLEAALRALPVSFETRLLKRGFRDDSGFSLSRKYVAARVDGTVLQLIVGETETIRSGGRRNVDGQSVYEAPAKPVLQLAMVRVKADEVEFSAALVALRPTLAVLSSVKTQREIIHSRLAKPVAQATRYRSFIELLNRARGDDYISSEERRAAEKRWRENPDDREQVEEELRRKMGEAT